METDVKCPLTVLVIDDDEDLLHIIEMKLKVEGFEPLISLNGAKVREIIAQSRPDLVLLDLHMQGINGEDICKDIKTDPKTASIPVLLFSANDNIREIQEECGADGFITKPLQAHNLTEAIQHYIRA